MMKKNGDLLQALMDRKRQANPTESPSSAVKPSTATLEKPASVPNTAPSSLTPNRVSLGIGGNSNKIGWTISPKFALFLGIGIVLGCGLFYWLGRNASGGASSGQALLLRAPSAGNFSWKKNFTIQATVLSLTDSDKAKLAEYKNYLENLGLSAEMAMIQEDRRERSALFVGGADRQDEKSLLDLRGWLADLPGPFWKGKPFASASVRETPRLEKK